MSLSLQATDRLFERLHATYGRDFMSKYEGLEVGAVKASWAHELAGFACNLHPLAWALEHLPERAPNVIEFRKIANAAPLPDVPRLEVVRANPARVAAELAKLAPLRVDRATGKRSDTSWAERLKEKDETAPHLVTPAVRTMYRAALGIRASSPVSQPTGGEA